MNFKFESDTEGYIEKYGDEQEELDISLSASPRFQAVSGYSSTAFQNIDSTYRTKVQTFGFEVNLVLIWRTFKDVLDIMYFSDKVRFKMVVDSPYYGPSYSTVLSVLVRSSLKRGIHLNHP